MDKKTHYSRSPQVGPGGPAADDGVRRPGGEPLQERLRAAGHRQAGIQRDGPIRKERESVETGREGVTLACLYSPSSLNASCNCFWPWLSPPPPPSSFPLPSPSLPPPPFACTHCQFTLGKIALFSYYYSATRSSGNGVQRRQKFFTYGGFSLT